MVSFGKNYLPGMEIPKPSFRKQLLSTSIDNIKFSLNYLLTSFKQGLLNLWVLNLLLIND